MEGRSYKDWIVCGAQLPKPEELDTNLVITWHAAEIQKQLKEKAGERRKGQIVSPRSTSRTFRDSVSSVKGFCRKAVPGSRTP